MSPDDLERIGAELARRTRRAQGLPPTVTDPATIREIARIVERPGLRRPA